MSRTSRLAVSLAALWALAGCEGWDEEAPPPTTATEGPATPSGERHLVAGIPVGTVEGTIRLADGEEEPAYADSPFDVATAGQLPAECSPPHGADRRPLAMDAARGLANVAVTATGDPEHWIGAGEPTVHELRIHDCRLGPVTITATRGDSLHVVNEGSYPFMPELGLGMLQSVLPSDPLDAPLDRAGPRTVQCAFAAPCGRAAVMVFHHPVHTVSVEAGHFRLENVPADQDVTITAWHPVIEAATATTRVTEGGTAHLDLVVHRFVPPAPEPPRPPLPPGMPLDPGAPEDYALPPTSAPPTSGPPSGAPPTSAAPTSGPQGRATGSGAPPRSAAPSSDTY
ncbi:MAG: hypothetical protein U0234_07810 [Sandaracinus sp.]